MTWQVEIIYISSFLSYFVIYRTINAKIILK